MASTSKAPGVAIEGFKRTKIIATAGPATDSYELIKALIDSGANGIRLNFSHGDYEEHLQRITWARKASEELGKPVAIIQDLQGPKIRLGDFEGIINVAAGQSLVLEHGVTYQPGGPVPIQYDISKKVKRGERLYIYDGKVRATITSTQDKAVHVRIENDGILIKRKGINLPDTDFGGDIITSKDKKDIAFGVEHSLDYIALSFVQSATDIRKLNSILRSHNSNIKIIAKIETHAAVEQLESIVQESDAVMIARGDLAIETSPESVPVIQRKIIGMGMRYGQQ
jgi:pyruvate kinase